MGRRGRLRSVLCAFVVATLTLPSTGCLPAFYLRDSACHRFVIDDPLLEARFLLLTEPLRYGVVYETRESLVLFVGHDGEAAMLHEPKRRAFLRARCRILPQDAATAVRHAVERLARAAPAERWIRRSGCRDLTSIVLHDDPEHSFLYCGLTPPAEIVRFVEEITEPLQRRFGRELAAGLAATAPWALPALPEEPHG